MCSRCSDASPSPRLVLRLKLHFKSPDFGRGFFLVRPAGCTCLTVIIMKIDKSLLLTRQGKELAERQLRHREEKIRDRLIILDIRQIVCILYVDENATDESRRE